LADLNSKGRGPGRRKKNGPDLPKKRKSISQGFDAIKEEKHLKEQRYSDGPQGKMGCREGKEKKGTTGGPLTCCGASGAGGQQSPSRGECVLSCDTRREKGRRYRGREGGGWHAQFNL